jgi:multidrug efflux pump subunit AcrB
MVVLTTVLGSIPLLQDPFFGAMAVCIIFGLSFAAVLSLIVMRAVHVYLQSSESVKKAG